MTDITALCEAAHAHRRAGRLAVAENLYRALLALDAEHAEAHRHLGLIDIECGRIEPGLEHLRRAVMLAPLVGDYRLSLADALLQSNRPGEALSLLDDPASDAVDASAVRALRERIERHGSGEAGNGDLIDRLKTGRYAEALVLAGERTRSHPQDPFNWKVFGTLLLRQARAEEAVAALRRAIELDARDPETLNSLARAYEDLDRREDAADLYRQALALQPERAEIWCNLGLCLQLLGQLDAALSSSARALELRPGFVKAHQLRGTILKELGRAQEALEAYECALATDSDSLETLNDRGILLQGIGRFEDALASFDRALRLDPGYATGLNNRANALKDLGRLDEALADLERAIALKPDFARAHSNRLFTLNYHPDKSAEEIFAAYRDYERRFGAPLRTGWRGHGNDRDPERRLRLGYVSADLRAHSLRSFLEPLLAHHDHGALELIAYAELARGDGVTERYRGWFDHWVDTRGLSDAALAERIRADAVDILIDLGGHTANNRLGVFARKPAPVSVSWMGYGYTTGLSAIDYFLSDAIMAPAGSEHLFAEQVWRLSAPAGVYRPRAGMGEVSALPALERGYVTFGTLSRGVRINHRVVRAWSALLARLPGSRLVVDSKDFVSEPAQRGLRERFAAHGIGAERLEIGYHSPPWEVLRGLDIGLDCFPHNSGTTLVESLYLGVPFITLAGRASVGRAGATVLHGVGHPEWVADSEEQYVDKALDLASDLGRLASIRAGLRDALESGPWCDEAGFARRVEQAYREMWRKWCQDRAPAEPSENGRASQRAELVALFEKGRFSELCSVSQAFTARHPEDAFGWKALGTALMKRGELSAALPALQRAVGLAPTDTQCLNTLANVLHDRGSSDDALACLARGLEINPQEAVLHNSRGVVLKDLGRFEEAIRCYRRALALDPGLVTASNNLGVAFQELGRFEESLASFDTALKLDSKDVKTLNNRGNTLKDLCRLDEALEHFERAIALEPGLARAHSNRLFALNYHPDKSAEEIFAAYRDYERRFGAPLRASWRGHGNDRDPDRRLRLGYVSADLRAHSLRSFLEPLLAHHEHGALELIAYAELARGDGVTERYRGWFDHWVDTRGLSDAALAERIRADAVDILIDLGGHTANNRLGVFARKPAPVSVSWMGYGYTTGLSAIDYFLSDAIMAPAGSEHLFAEQVWRLSAPAGVYRPRAEMGEVSALPALERGYVTFGTLSRGVRINHRVVRAWSALLARLPGSRLVVDSKDFVSEPAQRGLRERFAAHGIGPERLEIGYHSPPWEVLRGLDIGLDCFPHNSGTTLVESLYLGVPFITLAGRASVGRAGATVLHGVGHPEWVADSEEQYVDKALDLASDLGRLASIRAGLRDALESGPWCDEAGFARRVEQAYREMWRKWCGGEDGLNRAMTAPAAAGFASSASKARGPNAQSREPGSPGDLLDQGPLLDLVRAGRLGDAEDLARDRIRAHPGDAFARKVLGTLLAQALRNEEALQVLEEARGLDPSDSDTLNSLGRAYQALDRLEEAVESYRRALDLHPEQAEIWNNLGMAQQMMGQLEGALCSYDRALGLKPLYAKALTNRGRVLMQMGRLDESLVWHDRSLAIDPSSAEAHSCRGLTLRALRRPREALDAFDRALRAKPASADILNNKGVAAMDLGRFEDALACFEQSLAIDPETAETYCNLGLLMYEQARNDRALVLFDRALEIAPESIETWINRGIVLQDASRFEDALTCFQRVLAIHPDDWEALSNRGSVLKDQGLLDEALTDYERAILIEPDAHRLYSGRLYTLNYHPDKSAEEIFAAYRDYERRFGDPLRASWRAHGNDRDPDRRLRLGYVSADLRAHSLRSFLEPLLARHDHGALELIAYAELARGDGVTERYRGWFEHWVDTRGLSDAALAERIRADAVDILIDLGGHTANNRLGVFARKPAPVSVSWMGYGYTTGLSAIDYFLSDAIMAPAGSEHLFAEQVWRLSAPAGVYRPRAGMGEVSALPALERGYVTFGTLSRGVRINHRVVRAWSALLARLPGSRLVVDSKDFVSEPAQRGLRERFAAHGIGPERLEIGYHSPPWEVLRGLDIGLDCFPHNSGTTLVESLYLGVPFITLAGRASVGRAGATVLHGVGHPEWVADSEEQYVDKALDLASDLGRLASIRAGLRDALESGPWCDEAGFARRVEQAYREMWRKWCGDSHANR